MIHQKSALTFLLAILLLLPAIAQAADPKNEIQNTYFLENYYNDSVDLSPTKGTELVYIYRGLDRSVLLADVIYQQKYDRNESLQKLGGMYQVTKRLAIQQVIGFSSDKWTFPKFLADTEFDFSLIDRLSLLVGYKYSNFEDANVSVYAIGANFYPTSKLYLHGKILRAVSSFSGSNNTDTVANNSFILKAGFYPDIRNEVVFLYATNSESYLSVDQIGNFKADTYGLNWKYNLQGNWWLTAGINYQKRREPVQLNQRYMEVGWSYKW
ncbi:MAG: YaiO family outer membrane beta-barrel protein [bacterium]|nr:YaiO family outer membrane beta-barrel protein [bacterium]